MNEKNEIWVIQPQTLIDIADAIREKSGKTDPILVSNLDDEIRALELGGELYEYPIGYEEEDSKVEEEVM